MSTQTVGAQRRRVRAGAAAQSRAREELDGIAVELEALRSMTVRELHDEYRRLYGEPSHSRNKDYLRKKLAWRIQELAEGGLSTRARDRIQELLDGETQVRFRGVEGRLALPVAPASAAAREAADADRDPRLPRPGAVLRKEHRGVVHEIKVLKEGFEFRGERYTSLSTIAKAITGSTWNGFAFFGLSARRSVARNAPRAADEPQARSAGTRRR